MLRNTMTRRPELPTAFTERIRQQFLHEAGPFTDALDLAPAASIRRHPNKWPGPDRVFPSGPTLTGIPWTQNGFWLSKRPSFTGDPFFHAGSYYVQEASSMFLEEVLRQLPLGEHELLVLDACAAPGGKTTLLASALPQAVIVANEVIRSRVPALIENATKWGTGNILVTHNRLSDLKPLARRFDLVLADAPCSGEGLFRKDPDSRTVWNADLANHCSLRQRSILMDAWQALKPGGYFVYTTCTFHPDENEHTVQWLLDQTGAECMRLDLPELARPIHHIDSGPVTAYAFYPHRTAGEGFFLSVLRKPPQYGANDERIHPHHPGRRRPPLTRADSTHSSALDSWYTTRSLVHYRIKERLFSIHASHFRHLEHLNTWLNVVYAGWHSARIAGNDLRPAAGAALSVTLDKEYFYQYALDKEQALAYLRCEPLPVPAQASGTWYLAEYGGVSLGWLKRAGNRCNNSWPREWRIRNL